MNIELTGIDWLARGWLLVLAFTAAGLLVAALRKPCRRLFGVECAFVMWLWPVLAMAVSQLPHAIGSSHAFLPALVYEVASAGHALPSDVGAGVSMDWRNLTLLVWCLGMVMVLATAIIAQWRYRHRLRGAKLIENSDSRWPVLMASDTRVGPALVGAWRSRIVLPADFAQRYDAAERALILAHEEMHARRHDGCWCLLAQLVVALFWFHPLAWWTLAALRRDQELACDAAVVREHGNRRSYAKAMLKSQTAAFALPVGCLWSPRHPLTERIAMLKVPSPNRHRRHTGMAIGGALAFAVAGSVYAASAPQASPANQHVIGPQYQLDMLVELTTDDARKRHAETSAFALCMEPGKAATASVGAMQVAATTVPVGESQVRIDLAVSHAGRSPLVHRQLHGALGETLHAAGAAADGKHTYSIDVTPQSGCPARVLAEASPVKITEHVKNGTARAVAESIAAKAGWTLVNPEALGVATVTLSFNDMAAGTALQRVADLAGMKLALDGRRVRFAAK